MPDRIQRPVPVQELDQHFKPRGALKEAPIALERRFHVAADREPQVMIYATKFGLYPCSTTASAALFKASFF